MESYHYLRIGPREIAAHRDGISLNSPMVRFADAVGLFDRTQTPAPDDANVRRQIEDFQGKLAATPAFYWLVSEGNGRVAQVQAGRAYVRAQLAATAQGLSMQPLSQALQEYPEQAGPMRGCTPCCRRPRPASRFRCGPGSAMRRPSRRRRAAGCRRS